MKPETDDDDVIFCGSFPKEQEVIQDGDLPHYRQENHEQERKRSDEYNDSRSQLPIQGSPNTLAPEFDHNLGIGQIDYDPSIMEEVTDWPTDSSTKHLSPAVNPSSSCSTACTTISFSKESGAYRDDANQIIPAGSTLKRLKQRVPFPVERGTASSSSSVDRHSLTKKLKIKIDEKRNQPTSSGPFRSSMMPSDQSLSANKPQCLSQVSPVKTVVVPEKLPKAQSVNTEPNQGWIITMAESTVALESSDEPLSGAQGQASSFMNPVAQTAPPPEGLLCPMGPKTAIVWEGIFERCPGQAFPVLAYPLTANATSHWFLDSGFRAKQEPFTKRLQMPHCTTLADMFAFLHGDFQLAVVHFASPFKAELEETINYLHGKKKAGSCYREKDAYLTHLFVYALGREDSIPELLQGVIALQGERSDNMLLGLLVRMKPKQRHLPAAAIQKPSEKETQTQLKAMSFPFEFPNNLQKGDIDQRIQTNRFETWRRNPKLDQRLNARAAVAMQSLPRFQSQLQSQFQLNPRVSKAAHVPRQKSQSVHKAYQLSLPVEPVNGHDSDEDISCLNADARAFFRQTPIGQRIPVLLNGAHEQRKIPQLRPLF